MCYLRWWSDETWAVCEGECAATEAEVNVPSYYTACNTAGLSALAGCGECLAGRTVESTVGWDCSRVGFIVLVVGSAPSGLCHLVVPGPLVEAIV